MDDLRAVRDLLATPSRLERQVRGARILLRRPARISRDSARLGADAGVSFHGTSIQRYLDEAPAVTKPFSLHFAEEDDLVSLEDVERIRAALAGKDGEIVVYAGATHGFARAETPRYNPTVAHEAEERAFAMLDTLKTAAIV